jgi:hypothetical protein
MIKFRTAFLFLIMFQSWAGSAIALTIDCTDYRIRQTAENFKRSAEIKSSQTELFGPRYFRHTWGL